MTTAPRSSTPAQAQPWTTRRLLAWISDALTKNGIDSPRLSAEILLSHVLLCERLKLYMDPDRELDALELEKLRGLVGRALKHEPIQYLTGEAWFFGLPFFVDPRVLIPRPSTETIVEEVLQGERRKWQSGKVAEGEREAVVAAPASVGAPVEIAPAVRRGSSSPLLIADVCTGSGCIAVALAKNLALARVVASDVSAEALECARSNAERHAVGARVEFREGSLLEPLAAFAGQLDYLVANPPYIPDHEWESVEANVTDYEPTGALRAGVDGLEFVRPVLMGARGLLKPGGWVLVEIAASTASGAAEVARSAGLENVRVVKDVEGLERVVVGQRASAGA